MPGHLQKILYTAEAVAEGGREGRARSMDGRLVVDLAVPEAMGGSGEPGTNPEQLFAVGYAACFQSALFAVAAGRELDASESQIICRVGFGPTGHGGFGLTVALDLHAPFLTREQGADLMARAHERCPYSNATRGNIVVALSVQRGAAGRRGEGAVLGGSGRATSGDASFPTGPPDAGPGDGRTAWYAGGRRKDVPEVIARLDSLQPARR